MRWMTTSLRAGTFARTATAWIPGFACLKSENVECPASWVGAGDHQAAELGRICRVEWARCDRGAGWSELLEVKTIAR